jgi:GNAT superfamily N-acetyltransferase
MWTVLAEPVESPDAVALLRDYFAELTVRYFHRETTEQEIDETLREYPSTGLALFLILRAGAVPAGCLGLHPTGELTRVYVAPPFRRAGGARTLLTAAESWARTQRINRLFLNTRNDLTEARA